MDPQTFRKLEQADWAGIGKQLTAYAVARARNLVWRTGGTWDLAAGLEVKDIAAEAIRKVITGKRNWNPDRGELLPYLKGVVDSLMSHGADSKNNLSQVRFPEGEQGEELRDRSELDAQRHDHTGILTQQPPNPEVAAIGKENPWADERVSRLFELVDGAQQLEELLEAMVDTGETTAKPLAAHLRTTDGEINNRLRRLRRVAVKITDRDRQGASGKSTVRTER